MNCKSRWSWDHSFPTLNSGFTQTFNTEFQSWHPMDESTNLPLFLCLHLQDGKNHIPLPSRTDGCGPEWDRSDVGSSSKPWKKAAGTFMQVEGLGLGLCVCVLPPMLLSSSLSAWMGPWRNLVISTSRDYLSAAVEGRLERDLEGFPSTLKWWSILCQHTKVVMSMSDPSSNNLWEEGVTV